MGNPKRVPPIKPNPVEPKKRGAPQSKSGPNQTIRRDAKSGRFVDKAQANRQQKTTTVERVHNPQSPKIRKK